MSSCAGCSRNSSITPSTRTHQAQRATVALQEWGAAAFTALFNAGPAPRLLPAAIAPGVDQLRLVISSDDPQVLSWPWEALLTRPSLYRATCDIERKLTKDVADPPPLPATLSRDKVNILLVTCRPDGDQDVAIASISRSLVDLVHASDLPADVTILARRRWSNSSASCPSVPDSSTSSTRRHGAYGNLPPGDGAAPLSEHTLRPLPSTARKGVSLLRKPMARWILSPHPARSAFADAQDPRRRAQRLPAAMVDDGAQSAFASVAASLLHAGVRSVVAMAYSLYVTGAQRFLPAFYETLFRTGSFASATRGGRRAMLADKARVCAVGKYRWTTGSSRPLPAAAVRFHLRQTDAAKPGMIERVKRALPEQARLDQIEYGFVGRDSAILSLERGLLAPRRSC